MYKTRFLTVRRVIYIQTIRECQSPLGAVSRPPQQYQESGLATGCS